MTKISRDALYRFCFQHPVVVNILVTLFQSNQNACFFGSSATRSLNKHPTVPEAVTPQSNFDAALLQGCYSQQEFTRLLTCYS